MARPDEHRLLSFKLNPTAGTTDMKTLLIAALATLISTSAMAGNWYDFNGNQVTVTQGSNNKALNARVKMASGQCEMYPYQMHTNRATTTAALLWDTWQSGPSVADTVRLGAELRTA